MQASLQACTMETFVLNPKCLCVDRVVHYLGSGVSLSQALRRALL